MKWNERELKFEQTGSPSGVSLLDEVLERDTGLGMDRDGYRGIWGYGWMGMRIGRIWG